MDLTPTEFRSIYLSKVPITRESVPSNFLRTPPMSEAEVLAAPDTFDWRDHGAVLSLVPMHVVTLSLVFLSVKYTCQESRVSHQPM